MTSWTGCLSSGSRSCSLSWWWYCAVDEWYVFARAVLILLGFLGSALLLLSVLAVFAGHRKDELHSLVALLVVFGVVALFSGCTMSGPDWCPGPELHHAKPCWGGR